MNASPLAASNASRTLVDHSINGFAFSTSRSDPRAQYSLQTVQNNHQWKCAATLGNSNTTYLTKHTLPLNMPSLMNKVMFG